MTEFELIYDYFKQQMQSFVATEALQQALVVKSLGDDAAVVELAANAKWVTCVDTLVQGRHFSTEWDQIEQLAFAIGYKSVVVNVSDLAAMGAQPHSILLALALPQRLATADWLQAFAKGLFHACTQYGVRLIGGDTTRHDNLVISVTANGVMADQALPIYRHGAQVGDKVYVSGTLGDANYALQHADTEIGQQLAHRLHMPTPRVTLGTALAAQGLATAMIDVSDGLVQDLGHICQQSGVAMQLELTQLPASSGLQQVALPVRALCQLTGGDDYELAFTLPATASVPQSYLDAGHKVTCIGEVVAMSATDQQHPNTAITLLYQGQPLSAQQPYPFSQLPDLGGYQHFSKE
ncbi:thiamine-phosphate kinase [Psychrobacter sp. FDAARGOS_221]|uniref:thiamine-phosphate kinase n=1 Tax=Psychrobacter sp. FDAARGOS_221 TaxID=1975705 RepID=UPI000BB56FFD|nr:thiamine-phosphate kinase [Psychrobacter sp. FDAARGOS_221]PNK60863.1 thiamine-phosphate kinase [Psychrobacter sp. FDAARGOS_221]